MSNSKSAKSTSTVGGSHTAMSAHNQKAGANKQDGNADVKALGGLGGKPVDTGKSAGRNVANGSMGKKGSC